MKLSLRSLYQIIVPLSLACWLSACVGHSFTPAKTNQASLANLYSGGHLSHEFKEFKEEDKKRARTHLDTHTINNEITPQHAVNNLKDVLSIIPSPIFERFKEAGGKLEFDSRQFTENDQNDSRIAVIDQADPQKIVLNTHINRRNYTTLEKDLAVELITKTKFALEYAKYCNTNSEHYSPTKKAIIIAG